MTQEFLPKDPAKALVEIKEMLYQRLKLQREFLDDIEEDEWGHIEFDVGQIESEINFLQNLLDIIERS